MNPETDDYTEAEYVATLRLERHLYAWTLSRIGGVPAGEATAQALRRYPYESADERYRTLMFHQTAWHWAMFSLHGQRFWVHKPELLLPPEEYHHEAERYGRDGPSK